MLWCELEHYVKIIQLLDENLEACINEFPLWPDKTSIQESVPATFKNLYPDTRVIIDSAEIETDRSHNPIYSSLTWFDYKRRTFKSCIIYPFTGALQPVGL